MNGTPHNLNFLAKCLLKTKVYLNHRSFSDFTIDELNDYAGCIYDLGKRFNIEFEYFYLNRLTKEFSYNAKHKQLKTNGFIFTKEIVSDFIKFQWFLWFLEYIFNVDGADRFIYLTRVTRQKLSNLEKEDFNNFAKKFCDKFWYEPWCIFGKYKTTSKKTIKYFTDIGLIKRSKYGYSRIDMPSKNICVIE